MEAEEYGIKGKPEVILLHGGGLAPWSMRKLSSYLENDFHVTVPVLDGHAGSDMPFTTVPNNADRIIRYIDENMNGRVKLIAGLSLGAQILLEILSKRTDITDSAMIESADVCPSGIPVGLLKSSVRMSWKLTKKRKFAELRFRELRIRPELFDEYFRTTCAIDEKDAENFIASGLTYSLKREIGMTEARVHVVYGEKETRTIRKSAIRIKEALPSAPVTGIPGLHHGEASMNLHYTYCEILRDLLK